MKPKTRAFLLASTLLLAAPPREATAAEENLELDVLELGGGVAMLRSDTRIGNPTTLIAHGDEGVLIVDPNLELVAPNLLPAIRRLTPAPIRFVTATHFHGDHAENFELLAVEAPAATSFVPEAQRRRLATGEVVHGERPLRPEALPDLTFEGKLTLRLNGETIDFLTLPHRRGHTDGDEIVYFHNARVLYVGDYFFLDRFPVLDESGDLDGYLDNIAYLLAAFPEDSVVVPGHGRFRPQAIEASDMATFRRYHERLLESVRIVRQQLADGRSVDQIVERGLPESFAELGARPRYVSEEGWIRSIAAHSAAATD